MSTFHPADILRCEFVDFRLDASQGRLELEYALVGEQQRHNFVENISLPAGDYDEPTIEVASRLSRLLFLAAGLSYYKAAAPHAIVVQPPMTREEHRFLTEIIQNGLTEFAYVNNLPQALTPEITADTTMAQEPIHLSGRESAPPLVAIGGGKDSIVTLEALRSIGFSPLLFSVNAYIPIQRTVDRSGLPYVQAGRRISPELIALNRTGAYNGHVPVTVINSLIALITSILTGGSTVVFSNERSASAANMLWQGVEVNHQWSKGEVCERLVQSVLRNTISPDLHYFSLLRPFSELRIARQFARLTKYHDVFTSCNRAFHIDTAKRQSWCGHCDKCRFVFLILAPYLSPEQLVAIFHKNMFNDADQLAGFRELIGVEGHKPLECVGEIAESRAALVLAARQPEWQETALIPVLLGDVSASDMPTDAQIADIFSTDSHLVPAQYQAVIRFLA